MILSIGEILIDMIGTKNNDNIVYESFIGGAPFNLACNINKLGGNVGFVGRIGKDLLGNFLKEKANNFKFEYLELQEDNEHNTTVALVSIDGKGERGFSFLRKNCADYFIDSEIINEQYLKEAYIVHIGSLMLSEKEGRNCFDKILEKLKKEEKIISFDINYREDLFDNNDEALFYLYKGIKEANILKFSEEELYMLTKEGTLENAIKYFNSNQIVFITLSSKGSACFYHNEIIYASSIKVVAVDTTGAGDAFYAATLKQLDDIKIKNLNKNNLYELMRYSNICGALTTTNYGAVDAFPSIDKILEKL